MALAFSGALLLAGCDISSRSGEQEKAPEAEQKAETDPVPVPDAAAVAREISAGNYGEAARLAEAALSDRPGDPEMYLLLARAQARLQNVGSAVNALQAAFDAGFHDPRGALNHPDFDGIRTNRIFAEFVSRLQRSQSPAVQAQIGAALINLAIAIPRAIDLAKEAPNLIKGLGTSPAAFGNIGKIKTAAGLIGDQVKYTVDIVPMLPGLMSAAKVKPMKDAKTSKGVPIPGLE